MRSNTRRMVSWDGIPFGSSRKGDTKVLGQLNWDHLVGGFSLGFTEVLSARVFAGMIFLGY